MNISCSASQRASPTSRGSRTSSPLTYSACHQCRQQRPLVEGFSQTLAIGLTTSPTSSIVSRATAAACSSPGSTLPLTGPHRPLHGPPGGLAMNNVLPSFTMTATTASMGIRFMQCARCASRRQARQASLHPMRNNVTPIPHMAKFRVTVDTGGTFSDFVFFNEDTGEITITKVPSTPKEPFQAVLNGVKELIAQGVTAKDISFFSHGTTVGTNALLEEKGARTGLLVTEGFRGIYEVMEQSRGYGPATYDLFFEKPRLLAPPYYTEEIPERVDFRGEVLKPIDVEKSRAAIRKLKDKKVESIAACFLFSFLNPGHELTIKEIVESEFPEATLSLSCEVLPQIREFYRLSTTVINAYIAPVMSKYLGLLEKNLRDMGVTTPRLY